MTEEKNKLVELSEALANAVEQAAAATVLVNARRRFPATGIGYAPDLILTADHVVSRDENISVILPDGTEVTAQVVGRDPSSDLALLRLDEALATVAEISAQEARVGQMVLALGRPTTGGIQASQGVVSAIGGPSHRIHGGSLEGHFRTDAVPFPGFSGGPLVAVDGQVLGINTSGLSHGHLLSIPIGIAWQVAKTLAEHGSIKHGYLGVRTQKVKLPDNAEESLKRAQSKGLLLVSIEDESPAANSALMVGDILVGISGEMIENHEGLLNMLAGSLVGKPTPIEVLRGGVFKTITVTIGEQVKSRHMRRRKRMDRRHSLGDIGKHHPRRRRP
jgi:S1-C subfamily serine protease